MIKAMFWGLLVAAACLVVFAIVTILPDGPEAGKEIAAVDETATGSTGADQPAEAADAGDGNKEPETSDAGETATAETADTATTGAEVAALTPEEEVPESEETVQGGEPDASPSQTADTGEAAREKPVEADPNAPDFDLVRISADGQVVVAGRARPGEVVEVVLEGDVVGTAEADATGSFVAILDSGISDVPRQLVLRVAAEGGTVRTVALDEEAEETADQRDAKASGTSGDQTTVLAGVDPAAALGDRWHQSRPVIILPQENEDQAPLVVSPGSDAVEVLQPARGDDDQGLLLGRLTYRSGGDLIAEGQGEEDEVVRAYVDGELVSETPVDEGGDWQATIPKEEAEDASILRFDVVDAGGDVTRRVETPFTYAEDGGAQEVRQRRIVIQKGNNLWRIAEQHYGEGLRYSVIFGANRELIRNPDLIYPGQVFTVPELVGSQ